MRILRFLITMSAFAFGGNFTVMVSCENIPEYMAVCDINVTEDEITIPPIIVTPEYTMANTIKWGYSDLNGTAFVGPVQIRYENPEVEVFATRTDQNGSFTATIIPDEAFFVNAYNEADDVWATHDVKHILRIGTTTGNLLWKKWKPETSRWIKLDIDDNVALVSPTDENVTLPPENKIPTSIIYDMGAFQ